MRHGSRTELTSVKTSAAIEATRRIRASTPKSELRSWALRMQARHGGLAVQRIYRMRGITDPCEKARKVRSGNCARRRQERGLRELGIPRPRAKWVDIG
jgi:hypothetical protein